METNGVISILLTGVAISLFLPMEGNSLLDYYVY